MTLTPDQIWDRVVKSISHTVVCSLTTSGYSDRYIRMTSRYFVKLRDHTDACLEWSSIEAVVSTVVELTGRVFNDVYPVVLCRDTTKYFSSWYSEDHSRSTTAPVRPDVLSCIGNLASHAVKPRFTAAAVAEFRSKAASATRDELECARYWLWECNRVNALTGREQVPFPSLV
jgi:hypothetical protein